MAEPTTEKDARALRWLRNQAPAGVLDYVDSLERRLAQTDKMIRNLLGRFNPTADISRGVESAEYVVAVMANPEPDDMPHRVRARELIAATRAELDRREAEGGQNGE